MEWQKVLEGAKDGSIDVITCSWYLKNREKLPCLYTPTSCQPSFFAVNAIDPFEYKRIDDLAGKELVLSPGTAIRGSF